jgi:hypothetical protein
MSDNDPVPEPTITPPPPEPAPVAPTPVAPSLPPADAQLMDVAYRGIDPDTLHRTDVRTTKRG